MVCKCVYERLRQVVNDCILCLRLLDIRCRWTVCASSLTINLFLSGSVFHVEILDHQAQSWSCKRLHSGVADWNMNKGNDSPVFRFLILQTEPIAVKGCAADERKCDLRRKHEPSVRQIICFQSAAAVTR